MKPIWIMLFRVPLRRRPFVVSRLSGGIALVCLSVLLLVSPLLHASALQPYSEIELETLTDMYRMMDASRLEEQRGKLAQRQLELNRQLNAPENRSPDKQSVIRAQIERTHQELDIVAGALGERLVPQPFLERYKLQVGILLGLCAALGLLALVSVLRGSKRGSRGDAFVAEMRSASPQSSVSRSLPALRDEPVMPSGRAPEPLHPATGGAIPIQDLQSHVDHLLIETPNGYRDLMELVFSQAIAWHASDVHMQRSKGWFEVQYRIDGELHDICVLDLYREKEIISVIKVMAGLKFDRTTTALDGRIEYVFDTRRYDFRVSVIPTLAAEKVVIRIFDDDQTPYDLRRLGLSLDTTERWTAALRNRHGLLIVVGPAGAGKTTTIYSSLLHIKSVQRGLNIITLEDPVEHRLDEVTQIHIDPERGMDYEMAFTNILRQDPEVVMLGEIRSPGVARLAVRAGHTGHLVISTIHSPSTLGAFDRLLELGVEGYNLYNSLIAVLSQRLVKKVCSQCARPYQPDEKLLAQAARVFDVSLARWQRGNGCDHCLGRGYRERIVLDELIHLSPEARHTLSSLDSQTKRREVLRSIRNHTLWQDGVAKASIGLTTLEEVALMLGDMAGGDH